jgi:hypothetical protein
MSESKNIEDMIKRKFIYETTKEINNDKVFEVFIIS